ncbi:MAG: hypothetical protein M3Z25_00300 [Actinomycetota bacterium]|nr:hypothetical protein [Actinomycetota bacterium]
MHRFTEATPVSGPARVVEVSVDDWEIECCAPPPVVGQPTSWTLQFIAATASTTPELHRDSLWDVVERGSGSVLIDDAVSAFWLPPNGPAPRPGRARLHGFLAGTVHGGLVPDEVPRITGVVRRIRVIARRFVLSGTGPGRMLEPVPGTLTLTDVARSPRWFATPAPRTSDHPDNPPFETGVLLDLDVSP